MTQKEKELLKPGDTLIITKPSPKHKLGKIVNFLSWSTKSKVSFFFRKVSKTCDPIDCVMCTSRVEISSNTLMNNILKKHC